MDNFRITGIVDGTDKRFPLYRMGVGGVASPCC